MNSMTPFEDRRLILQAALDAQKSQAERNKLGQFATPTGLASDVLAYARHLMPQGEPIRFLDPAIGTGSFYAALLREFPIERIEAAQGFEIDPHYGKPSRELWDNHPLDLTLEDFTTANAPTEGKRYNLLICNPPYVRHHHMDKATKARLLAATGAAAGIKMAGLSGLYCYFLGLAHAWMEADGIAGWLIPSEFMDVNYGVPVKHYLLNNVELVRIHRFDPNDLQFGDALVSSAVVWFRKRKPCDGHRIEFSYGGTLSNPKISRLVAAADLKASDKWTSLAAEGVRITQEGRKIVDFFDIKRGLATGDNKFFIMTRAQIAAHDLPMQFFRPILPGPRDLDVDVIEAKIDGTPKINKPLFMLDCRLPEHDLKDRYPTLWAYLQTGKETVAQAYLCKNRSPWYAQEKRAVAPFICTYMGRSKMPRAKPFRFILNQSQATAANVYLLLYPKPALARALASNPDLGRRVWEFLNSIDAATLLGEGRVYGGGLYKMEPKELANVPAEAIAAMLPTVEHYAPSQGEMFTNAA